MSNKNKWNKNKIILGDLNCTMDKMDRDGGNKTQRLYRCRSNKVMSKLIVDNGVKELWRRENQDSSVHLLRKILWHKIQDRQCLYWYKSC